MAESRARWAGLCLLVAGPVAAGEPSILGEWARGDGKAIVRIEPCATQLCAINTWIKPGTKDEKVGDRLIMSVSSNGPASLAGEAFDPQRDMTFRMRIKVGEQTMTSRGCVLAGFVCKDMSWRRLGSAAN